MKDIRSAIRDLLLANPTVSGLVDGFRVHHQRLPQDQVDPSIVYNRISDIEDYNMAGSSGLVTIRMQVDAWAQDSDLAANLSNAARDVLTGARGVIGTDQVDVNGVFVIGGRDDYDEVTKLYRASRDYNIWYRAT